jgi:hypothetical protein
MNVKRTVDREKKLLAAAVFELRILLASHLHPDDRSTAGTAARLAYALHNEALAVLEGRPFDLVHALDAVVRLEPELGKPSVEQFRHAALHES